MMASEEGELVFFKAMAPGRWTMFLWMIPTHDYLGSTDWTQYFIKKEDDMVMLGMMGEGREEHLGRVRGWLG